MRLDMYIHSCWYLYIAICCNAKMAFSSIRVKVIKSLLNKCSIPIKVNDHIICLVLQSICIVMYDNNVYTLYVVLMYDGVYILVLI